MAQLSECGIHIVGTFKMRTGLLAASRGSKADAAPCFISTGKVFMILFCGYKIMWGKHWYNSGQLRRRLISVVVLRILVLTFGLDPFIIAV
jgi:hypothetical protein